MARRSSLNPAAVWIAPALEGWRIAVEAQTIIAIRMMGMAGILPAAAGENMRMFTEKGPAFAEAYAKGMASAMRLDPPEKILRAAQRPIRRRTRANAKRLMA